MDEVLGDEEPSTKNRLLPEQRVPSLPGVAGSAKETSMTLYIQPDRSQWWSVDTVTMEMRFDMWTTLDMLADALPRIGLLDLIYGSNN
jgi:hypothetical protein